MVMRAHRLVRQTALLSGSHFVVRIMGFSLRVWLSRELGAQAMGLVELTHSAQSLLIAPVASGLPAAVSRLSAQRGRSGSAHIALLGAGLSLLVSVPLASAAFLLRGPFARWLGDLRTLPALLCILPCLPVLGLSCALNGYCYGTNRPAAPALSELLEQTVRLLLCLYLVPLLRGWPTALRAAVPALSMLLGEAAGLLLMLLLLGVSLRRHRQSLRASLRGARVEAGPVCTELIALALPLTGMRLVSSLMHTVNAALIPARLQVSGLAAPEALSRFGMMHGMLLPVLLMPSFITGSISMVTAPELARRQAESRPMRHLIARVLGSTMAISLPAMTAVYLLAPLIANVLYRQAELLSLLRVCCPLVPVMALAQVSGGMMNGLGLQRHSLRISLASNLLSLLLMVVLAARPSLRLWGAILGMAGGQLLTLLLNLCTLLLYVNPERGCTAQ